jgi:hypothetical protein
MNGMVLDALPVFDFEVDFHLCVEMDIEKEDLTAFGPIAVYAWIGQE